MWYDMAPAQYASGLQFYAERNEEAAFYKDREGKPWSVGEAARNRRTARRLRAMAKIAENSTAIRAGDVDFLGMQNPSQTLEEEEAAIAAANEVKA